jgi:hypothetical protein
LRLKRKLFEINYVFMTHTVAICGYARLRHSCTCIHFLSQVSTDGQNWAPLLANCGLLLMSCAHCLVTIVSGFRCYRQVCPCVGHRDRKQPSARWPLPDSPEPAGSFYSTSSKELLVSNWLGQQRKHNMLLIAQPPVGRMALRVHLSSCVPRNFVRGGGGFNKFS